MRARAMLWLVPVLLAGCAGAGSPVEAPLPSTPGWTGEIRVSFTGCTSCADCRAAIRQISQSQSGSDRVDFHAGVARITYPGPAAIRAAEVANALSVPGVIKGQVDQVELRVEGLVEKGADGTFFTAPRTGQRWRIAEGSVPVPVARTVVVVAALEGWQGPASAQTLRVLRVETP